ncbi:MAG: ABC transporter ATP-binding protein [Candidatus Binatia bacterium]
MNARRPGALLRLEELRFHYPGSEGAALGPLTLTIAESAMVAIVGPNGSGKTTLLRLMSGLVHPLSGSVEICGMDPRLARRADLAKRVAVVGQQALLGFPYSVAEVVLMGRAPYGGWLSLENERDLEAAREALRLTDTLDLARRSFDSLSSGERQRVTVARALAQEPSLLLLDEPAAFLDIKQQTRLYDLLASLNRDRGLTVVSVLHDLNLASAYFDTVAMLRRGRLFAVGSPEEVITYGNVREVFETDVYVTINDLSGQLNVLPLPASSVAKVQPS